MRYRQAASATLMIACVVGAVTTATAAAASPGAVTASRSDTMSTAAAQTAPNTADIEFVRMMIPHHYQALVMSRMVPDRSADEDLRALAERIDVEQSVEIAAMQGWQGRNGLEVTDAQESYESVLEQPELLEQMGMATPAELDDLSAAEGTAFDVLFLRLMIDHHEGAVTMAENVIINGSDVSLRQMAIDMMSTQNDQIQQMQDMLEGKTS